MDRTVLADAYSDHFYKVLDPNIWTASRKKRIWIKFGPKHLKKKDFIHFP